MSEPQTDPRQQAPQSAGTFGSARTLFRVRDIPVRVDASLLLMGVLVVVAFAPRYGNLLGDLGMPVVVLSSVAFAVLFFASILVHELGHAFASLDRGIPVAGITLFALGGVTESTREAERAGDEFVIVGIGPFMSLVLAALFGLVYTLVEPFRPAAAVAGYLAWANLGLAIFNVLPGYPLDGGRLLRSILWSATGQPHRATRWAARVGQVFAIALIVWGAADFLGYPLTVQVGPVALGGSLWNAFIGLFLLRGATEAYRRAEVRERLAARTVRQLMGSVPPAIPADLPVGQAVGVVQTRPSLLWPVGPPLSGAVTLEQLDRVPSTAWSTTPVGAVALPLDDITVEADERVDDVIERLAGAPGAMLLVIDRGSVVGLLTPSLVGDAAS